MWWYQLCLCVYVGLCMYVRTYVCLYVCLHSYWSCGTVHIIYLCAYIFRFWLVVMMQKRAVIGQRLKIKLAVIGCTRPETARSSRVLQVHGRPRTVSPCPYIHAHAIRHRLICIHIYFGIRSYVHTHEACAHICMHMQLGISSYLHAHAFRHRLICIQHLLRRSYTYICI